jgi:hypothetical protein
LFEQLGLNLRESRGMVDAFFDLAGLFGLVPRWAADATITRYTYNARSESVASKPIFREAWRRAQHWVLPAEAFYEPDWRTGKPIPTRFARADAAPQQELSFANDVQQFDASQQTFG